MDKKNFLINKFLKRMNVKVYFLGNVNRFMFSKIMLLLFILILCTSCSTILKPRPMAYERNYATEDTKEKVDDIVMNEEIDAEDMSDVKKYVKQINFDDMTITDDMDVDLMWEDLVDNTEYIRMPVGYEEDFNLRKYLSVDYVYNVYVKGLPDISWEDECDIVKDFLVKKYSKK